MKKINVLLTVALLIVTALLITVVFNKESVAKVEPDYKMNCKGYKVEGGALWNHRQYLRCENVEMICYISTREAMSCVKKK